MSISLGDHQNDCSSNLRFADDVLLFTGAIEKNDDRLQQKHRKKYGLKIHRDATQVLSNQRSNRKTQATIDNIKVEVQPISEKAKYLGQTVAFEKQETIEIKSRIRAARASCTKYNQESGVDIEIVSSAAQASPIQHGHHLHADMRFWTVDALARTREAIRSTQCKMLRFIVQTKRKYKTITRKDKVTESQRAANNEREVAEDERCQQKRQPTPTKDTARTQDAINTVTYLSRVTQNSTWTRQTLKMRTNRIFQKKQKRRRGQDASSQHSVLVSKNTKKNEMGG